VGAVHRISTAVYPTGVALGFRTVLVQQKVANGGQSMAGASADTYVTTSTSYIDRYVRVTSLTHRGSSAGSQSGIRFVVMQPGAV
jgi:hypothetical protein